MFRYVCGRAKYALVITGLLLAGCGKNGANANLPAPNGRLSQSTVDYVAVAEIILPGGRGLCTGTFIAPRAFLTAAHCAKDDGDYQVIASFGTFTTSTKVVLGQGTVSDVNDIAIFLFDQDVADRSQGQVYDLATSAAAGETYRLVGFGCNNVNTRQGAGTKRTGTNVASDVTDYITFQTPITTSGTTTGQSFRGIIGPENRAGSCFGDSGGPALLPGGASGLTVAGVTHAGGPDGDVQISEYTDVVNNVDNRAFLSKVNSDYSLGIQGL